MLLRLKIIGVHSVVLPVPGGYEHHGACYAAAPCCWRRSRTPAAGSAVARRPRGSATVVMALKEEPDGSRSGFAGGGPSWDPGLEIQVPFEQRPVNEYSALKDSTLYSWAELSPGSFFLRLGGLCLVTFSVLAAPIAAASFNPGKNSELVICRTLRVAGAVKGVHRQDHFEGDKTVRAEYDKSKEMEMLKDSTQTMSISSVLIATVTFGATFLCINQQIDMWSRQ